MLQNFFKFGFFLFCSLNLFAFEVGDSFGEKIKNYSFDDMKNAPEYNIEKFSNDGIVIKILQSNLFGARPLSDFILHTSGFLTAYQNGKKLGTFAFVEYRDDGELNFFYDYDGDNIIDAKADEYFIPSWVLFKANIKRRHPEEFLNLCNQIYTEFNSDVELNEYKIKNLNLKIAKNFQSLDCEDYSLYYAYLIYLTQIENKNSYKILRNIEKFIQSKFRINNIPLLKLYIAESFFNLQKYDIAIYQFNMLKNCDANSRLADFYLAYIYDLKNNTNIKTKKFEEAFPKMWILKTYALTK